MKIKLLEVKAYAGVNKNVFIRITGLTPTGKRVIGYTGFIHPSVAKENIDRVIKELEESGESTPPALYIA